MHKAEQLLYQTEKSSHRSFSINALYKIFAIFTGKHLCETSKNTYFEEHLRSSIKKILVAFKPKL